MHSRPVTADRRVQSFLVIEMGRAPELQEVVNGARAYLAGAPFIHVDVHDACIEIRVIGKYHQFGNFASQTAALSRIVTLHDLSIDTTKEKGVNDGQLVMSATAKTYRYLDEKSHNAGGNPNNRRKRR